MKFIKNINGIIKYINKKSRIIGINAIAIVSLFSFYFLGIITTDNVTPVQFRYFVLGLATLTVFLGMFNAFLSLPNKGNGTTLTFVLSLFSIMLAFSIAYSMIYYIGLSNNKETFRFYNCEKEVLLFFDFVYYSVVTFTTLGYGDIVPVSYIAKFYTMIETLIFVIYISIVVLNFSSINFDKNNNTAEQNGTPSSNT